MQKTLLLLAIATLTFFAQKAPEAEATIMNGSFENPYATGWELETNWDINGWTGDYRPESFAEFSPWSGSSHDYSPTDGNYAVEWRTAPGIEPYDGNTTITSIKQTCQLEAGNVLSGQAAFWTFENEDLGFPTTNPIDTGWVKIYDEFGDEIANPWFRSNFGLADGFGTEWEYWQWEANVAGTYTIALGIEDLMADGQSHSYVLFDDINVKEVPEPSAMLFLGIFLAAIGLTRGKEIFDFHKVG